MNKIYDIDTLLDEVVTLPSLPDTVVRLTDVIDSPDCPLSEIAHIISSDPALAMKTLRLINSAYYGLTNKVTTIEHSVVLLGAKVIKNLALTATVFDSMSQTAGSFLAHCAGVGVAMSTFSRVGAAGRIIASSDEAFLFGLLHDIGRIIFAEAMPQHYASVIEMARRDGMPLWQAERQLIGVDHAELGGKLADRWRLNKPMVDAISGHHNPAIIEGEFQCIAATLSLADFTAYESGLPCYDGVTTKAADEAWDLAKIKPVQLPEILDNYFELYPTVQDFVQLLA